MAASVTSARDACPVRASVSNTCVAQMTGPMNLFDPGQFANCSQVDPFTCGVATTHLEAGGEVGGLFGGHQASSGSDLNDVPVSLGASGVGEFKSVTRQAALDEGRVINGHYDNAVSRHILRQRGSGGGEPHPRRLGERRKAAHAQLRLKFTKVVPAQLHVMNEVDGRPLVGRVGAADGVRASAFCGKETGSELGHLRGERSQLRVHGRYRKSDSAYG